METQHIWLISHIVQKRLNLMEWYKDVPPPYLQIHHLTRLLQLVTIYLVDISTKRPTELRPKANKKDNVRERYTLFFGRKNSMLKVTDKWFPPAMSLHRHGWWEEGNILARCCKDQILRADNPRYLWWTVSSVERIRGV